jgi:hypothetical protein
LLSHPTPENDDALTTELGITHADPLPEPETP